MHTAILIGVGMVLSRLREHGQLVRGVRLIFQPAEETSPGGALDAIEGGVLTDVTEVYALHCDPRTEVGRLAFKVGPITAAVDRVKITLTGAGGHTSRPHLTADLVGALGAVATSMQLLLSRRVDPRSGVSLVWVESTPVPSPTRSPRPGPSRARSGRWTTTAGSWPSMVPQLAEEIVAPFPGRYQGLRTDGVPPAVNHLPASAG